ncbi:MAG TPA: hypothetical protein VGG74_03695 [Kofleriaceae bacterium]|jgi:hypothetical protein
MSHEDEALDVDLHAWGVPEPAAVDASSLVARVLRPVVAPAKPARLRWLAVAIVVVNAAIAALLVIVLPRADARRPVAIVLPAGGGGSADVEVRALMARLEQEQRDVERKLDEIRELRALVAELSQKLARYDQQTDHHAPKQPDTDTVCDEVSCVLNNYEGACCKKLSRPHGADDLPDALDRASISSAIAAVRTRVEACGDHTTGKGVVKVHVDVDASGAVSSVTVVAAPSIPLGTCVRAAIEHATFARTQYGGRFTYPFVF